MKAIIATIITVCIAVFVAVNFFGVSVDSLVSINKVAEPEETVTEKAPEVDVEKNIDELVTEIIPELVIKQTPPEPTPEVPEPIIGRLIKPGEDDPVEGLTRKKNQSILVPGTAFISMPKNLMLLAYRDEACGKYGFVMNNSGMTVSILPEYDDVRNTGYSLIPVIKNGKFGIVDGAVRHHFNDEPIVPCEYDDVQVIDNNTAILTKGNVRKRIVLKPLI